MRAFLRVDRAYVMNTSSRWSGCDSSGMKYLTKKAVQSGKLGWIFLWLIGVPIPVLLFLFLIRGCT